MEVVALLISVLALIVSIFSARYSRQQSRSSAALASIEADRRADEMTRAAATEKHAKHADVDVRLAAPEANSSDHLIVDNRGPALASGVAVSFVRALSAGVVDGAFERLAQRRFDLRSGDSELLRLSPSYDTATRYEIAVRWTDAAGDQERVRVIDHLR